ncbi:MAG: UvrD-helicase domain-containing protein [Thermoleophilia bacterium]
MAGDFTPTQSQQQAINQLDGKLFIAAGAGSGKTSVVANRFVEAIARGKAEVDSILTITFTKKAAAEMMKRIREELRGKIATDEDLDRVARMKHAYRNIETARISTIDSFYAQVLRANALAADLDPGFDVADESRSLIIRQEVFDVCLQGFIEMNGTDGEDFILAYDPRLDGTLFKIINDLYGTIRNRGQEPGIPVPVVSDETCRAAFDGLLTAIECFDEAVEREDKGSLKSVMEMQESNWHLRGAARAAEIDAREQLLILGKQKKPGSCKIKTEMDAVVDARHECWLMIQSIRATGTLRLMNDLLVSFHEGYSRRKRDEGVLDFADLAQLTHGLLTRNASVRSRLSSSFKMIMVDEFQDTNQIQYEITRLLDEGNLMMVGDEKQSIYGFRDAEVGLFQREDRESAAAGCRIPLVDNFRSQPEILAFVDEMFDREEMLGENYMKLEPMAARDVRKETERVEVILVDSDAELPEGEKKLKTEDFINVEAQLVAERLRDLQGDGYAYGDMAILMATRKHAELYRDALDRLDISNYLAIGVSYFNRVEMGDAINMFRLLVNPLDDVALTACLRSHLVGVADDTLYWLRQVSNEGSGDGYEPLWPLLSSAQSLKHLDAAEREKLIDFSAGLRELRRYASRNPLQATARRIIFWNDYAATMAAKKGGKQVVANLMKLIDLAADYEAAWGHDLVAFTEFVSNQKTGGTRESDAPIEEEGVDSVRIMTMHEAKGLEFPLVVLPKLNARKGGGNSKAAVLLDRDKSSRAVGLRYSPPGGDEKLSVFDYDLLEEKNNARELAEEKRLNYVAMTRAKKHLILVGSARLGKPAAGYFGNSRPLDWIRTTLSLDRDNRPGLDSLEVLKEIKGAAVRLQTCSEPLAVLARADEASAVRSREEATGQVDPAIGAMPPAAIHVPAIISPTAIDLFDGCPRRYFFEKVVRAGKLFDVQLKSWTAPEGHNLNAADRGTLVHHILETDLELAFAKPPTAEYIDAAAESIAMTSGLTDADRQLVADLVARAGKAPVATILHDALKAGSLEPELGFSMLVGKTIIGGFIDAFCPLDGGSLVVDYKTSRPPADESKADEAGLYRYQMASYALAAVRMIQGPVKVVLLFLGGDEPREVIREYSREQAEALEAELRGVIESMAPGDFPPIIDQQCNYCTAGPNGAGICSPAAGKDM